MTAPSAPSPAASLDTRLAVTRDFPDWLGPVLIKELRQGLRSGLFLWAFRVLPVVLALQAVWTLSTSDIDDARSAAATFFWLATIIPTAVLGPMRALGGIRSEREALALDLLQLTPLSSWRIVLAKWSSLMAQVLLWATSLLPFFLLRYFLGGMDLLGEASLLAQVLLFAGLATALGLAVSTLPKLVFWLAIAGSLLLIASSGIGLASMFFRPAFGGGPASGDVRWSIQVLVAGPVMHVTLLLIAWTASRIAPPAENHAMRLRLLLLAFAGWPTLAAVLLGPNDDNWGPLLAIGIALVVLSTAIELTTNPSLMAVHLQPWRRLGLAGRALRGFFLPGWYPAMRFSTTLLVPGAVALVLGVEEIAALLFCWGLILAVFLPRTLIELLARRRRARPHLHWLLHLLGVLAGVVVLAFHSILKDAALLLAAVLPTSLPWLCVAEETWTKNHATEIAAILSVWTGLVVVVAVLRSRGYREQLARLDASARAAAHRP